MKSIYLVFLLLFVTVNLEAQVLKGPKDEINSIIKASERFSAYYMNSDIDGLVSIYTSDAKILPPGADIISGHDAIKKRWTLPDGVTILHHKSIPEEIEVMGSTAYDVGYYEGRTKKVNGEEESWRGKYVIVWKKEGGDWKMYLDIWNPVAKR
jgi:ketosteroid isomerase-like protein